MRLNELLNATPCFFPLLPLIIGLKRIPYLKTSDKFLVLLSALGVGVCWIAVFGKMKGNNIPSLHLWTFLEFTCIASFYLIKFKNKSLKLLIGILSLAFIIFTIINSLYIQGLNTYNSHARGLEATLLTTFSLLYIIHSIKSERFFHESFNSDQYYLLAIMIYFGCMQFLYLSYNFIANHKLLSSFSFQVHKWLNLAFNILLTIALWKKKSLEKPNNLL